MNRTERRRSQKQQQGKRKTYNLTEEQIEKIKMEATGDAFKMLIAIPVLVLHDKFGYGRIRLDRFTHYCFSWVDGVQKGEVSLEEICEICEKEAGVKITTKRGKND